MDNGRSMGINGFYRERIEDVGQTNVSLNKNHIRNSAEGFQQSDNVLDDGYPYENQTGFFRENPRKVHEDPVDDDYCVNPRGFYQNRLQSLRHSPPISSVISNYDLHEGHNSEVHRDTGEMVTNPLMTHASALYKLGELCEQGKVKEAVGFLSVFEKTGMAVDGLRYIKLMESCGDAKSLESARRVHDHLSRTLGKVDIEIHNKILDMYFKCGSTNDARQSFEKMPLKHLTSWEIMIRGFTSNGLAEEAIDLFTQMKKMGLEPNGDLFNAILYTCGVLGAIDQGMLYFESMKVDFGVTPKMEDYVGIIEMLGRSGYLDEALEFIEMMPIEPNVDVWEALLKFCRVNGYTELGDRCAEIVEQLDSSRVNKSNMALLNIESSETVKGIESKKDSNVPDFKHQVREFMAGDRSHPDNDIIYQHLRCLAQHMKEVGYTPDKTCSLHDVDIESREEALLYHSERLATVHGLMTTRARMPLRIIKNLRVCRDCHNALKIISKIVGRLIIARDIKRFHHFENGVCSCNDYW
ncbi:pentatricopeptide repeat-containing protein At2g25580-like isoform X2 [Asparagus officinalis]|nr:pentatricopeptide repeat-containing protein At2g25580-like isoform X2 [Asparagus officinalis]